MAKFLKLTIYFVALVWMFFACNKADTSNDVKQDLYQQAIAFLKEKQTTVNPYQSKKLDALIQNLSKENTQTIKIGETSVLLFDLKTYKNARNTEYTNTYYKMSFPMKGGIITSGLIYTIHTNLARDVVSEDMQAILLTKSKEFGGQVVTNALNDRFIQAVTMKEGHLEKTFGLQTKDPKVTGQPVAKVSSTGCTAYYLVTTTYYSDGHIEETWDYLFTECSPCYPGGQPYDEGLLPVCGDGGGGGNPDIHTTDQISKEADEEDSYGQAPTIKYTHPATIARVNGEVISVIMSPVTVKNPVVSYTDDYARPTTRTLTLLGQSYNWTPLGTTAYLYWFCFVHGKYVYGDGVSPIYTRQWSHTYSGVF